MKWNRPTGEADCRRMVVRVWMHGAWMVTAGVCLGGEWVLDAFTYRVSEEQARNLKLEWVSQDSVLLAFTEGNHCAELKDFAESFLNPERNGYAVGPALRDEARAALGMNRVES